MVKAALLFLALLVCAGCASVKTDDEVTGRFDVDRIEVDMERDNIVRSFQSPLYMLNIKKEDIPKHLPGPSDTYTEPSSCLMAGVEYEKLNILLGRDDAQEEVSEFSSISLDAGDAIESTISDFIPFESVIKYVSGATKHQKKVAAAYFRGQIRRAFLKGYIQRNMCEVPTPTVKPDPTLVAGRLNPGIDYAASGNNGFFVTTTTADTPGTPYGDMHTVDADGTIRFSRKLIDKNPEAEPQAESLPARPGAANTDQINTNTLSFGD